MITADPEEPVREKAIASFRKIRQEAESQSEPEITLEEINAEINAIRQTNTEQEWYTQFLTQTDWCRHTSAGIHTLEP